MNKRQLDSISSILIRSVNWIGDAVMTTPVLAIIRERFPHARITLLANEMVSELLSGHPALDEIITFRRSGIHRGVGGRLKLAAQLRRCAFDLAIILPNSFDAAVVPWLAGIPFRLGKCSDGRTLLLNGRYEPARHPHPGHEVQYYVQLLASFGISGTFTPPALAVTPEESAAAAATLAGFGIHPGDTVVGINPGASYGSAKRWYPERFAQVAAHLSSVWSAKILVFGGPGEAAIAADIVQQLPGTAVNLAGKTTVRSLMALIKRCNFFITNDSGPMHIAAAFDVPLVAIFGSTDHTGTSPYNRKAAVVRSGVPCAPCKLRECPTDHICMTSVSAESVIKSALSLAEHVHSGAVA